MMIYLQIVFANKKVFEIMIDENCDIAIAMSPSCADPVLGWNILSYCPGWGYCQALVPSPVLLDPKPIHSGLLDLELAHGGLSVSRK